MLLGNRTFLLLVGFVALASVSLAGDADDAGKADLKRMQGKWKVVSVMSEGKAEKAGFTYTISGNKMYVGGGWYSTLTLDAKVKPRAFDFEHYDAGGTLKSDKGMKAIYMFDGDDKLKLCLAQLGGRPRPKAFFSKAGDGNRLLVLERVKE